MDDKWKQVVGSTVSDVMYVRVEIIDLLCAAKNLFVRVVASDVDWDAYQIYKIDLQRRQGHNNFCYSTY